MQANIYLPKITQAYSIGVSYPVLINEQYPSQIKNNLPTPTTFSVVPNINYDIPTNLNQNPYQNNNLSIPTTLSVIPNNNYNIPLTNQDSFFFYNGNQYSSNNMAPLDSNYQYHYNPVNIEPLS